MKQKYQKIFDKAIKHKETPDEMSKYYFLKECNKLEDKAILEGIVDGSPSSKAERLYKITSKAFITNEFLQNIERLGRYSKDYFSVGDADTGVEDLGVFKGRGREYDATLLTDNATTFNHNKYVILVERVKLPEFQPKIFVYSIVIPDDDNPKNYGNKEYTQQPNLERLKKDFSSRNYTAYNSLIEDNGIALSIQPFNEDVDRIASVSIFIRNIDSVLYEEEDLFKDIPVYDYSEETERLKR